MPDVLVRLRPGPGVRVPAGSAPAPALTIDSPLRLVVCPPAGAGAAYARPLLRAGVELWAVRYPGRESRIGEPFATRLTQLATEAAAALRPLLADGRPTVLLGHSMGVGVAVETDRLLAEAPGPRRRPRLLTLSAQRAPAFGPERVDRAQLRRIVADDAALHAWVERLGGVPPELLADADFMAMCLPILRADLLISLEHAGLPYAGADATPLLLLHGDADPIVPPDSMRAWAHHTRTCVTSALLRGGHHALTQDTDGLYTAIGAALQRAPGPAAIR